MAGVGQSPLHCNVEFYDCVVICLKTTHGTLLSAVINIFFTFLWILRYFASVKLAFVIVSQFSFL